MASAPFRNCLVVGRVGKGLQLGRFTQKLDNVVGTESEGGDSRGYFFPASKGLGSEWGTTQRGLK